MRREKRHTDVISSMFLSASIAIIFTLFVGMAAQFFDGIITSRFLGGDAYSAIALFGPFNGIVLMIASFLSSGNQIVCSGYIGGGKKEEANSVFSFSVLAGLAGAVLLIAACMLFPDLLLSVCGVTQEQNPELYDHMRSYMRGYMPGIPALILIQIIGPMIVLDNGKRFFTLSAIVLCGSDIAGDLLNALYFRMGTYGMGLATSASFVIQLLMLLLYLNRQNSYFRFSVKSFRPTEVIGVCRAGFPSLIQDLSVDLRDLFINRINLFFALSSAALVARGIQYDLNMILFCIGVGIGKTMMTMAGIYYGANDRVGLRHLFSYGLRLSLKLALATTAVVFLLAPWIVSIYTSDEATAALCVFGIRCMSVALAADVTACAFLNYLQGIRKRRLVTFFNFMDRFVLPITSAAVLGILFGTKGLLASIMLGKLLLLATLFLAICLSAKRIPRGMDDVLLLPETFGGGNDANRYGRIMTIEDAVHESMETERFCLERGACVKAARRMALFMEEMAGNIVEHGNPDPAKRKGAEFRLFADRGRACLTLRDYNMVFDPTEWYHATRERQPGEATGIRIVMGLAQETYYFSAFNSNNLVIWLDLNQ